MKKLMCVITILSFSGCATGIRYNSNQECSARGMVLDGVSISHESARASGYNYYSGTTTVNASSSYESANCEYPKDDAKKCEAKTYLSSTEPINEYNDGIGGKRLLNGLGYLAFIVPGIVLKIIYDNQRSDAISESRKIMSSNSCPLN